MPSDVNRHEFFGELIIMTTLKSVIRKLVNNEDGAALVEYGMLVGLIAAICIVAVTNIGTKISTGFGKVDTALAPIVK